MCQNVPTVPTCRLKIVVKNCGSFQKDSKLMIFKAGGLKIAINGTWLVINTTPSKYDF
jgi:hypothetical protein